jgi:hypothetical protein
MNCFREFRGEVGLVVPKIMNGGSFGRVASGYSEKNKTILILGLDFARPHQ